MSPRLIGDRAGLATVETDWRRLALDDPASSYFTSPDWILGWLDTLGRGTAPHVAVWPAADGGVAAVVPMGSTREPLHPRARLGPRVWRLLGTGAGAADHSGWVARPDHDAAVRDWLTGLSARRSVLLSDLDPDVGARALPAGAVPLGTRRCPRITVPADGAEVGGSSKHRKQVRAYRRKVDRAGIRFRWCGPGAMTAADLDTVLHLHALRAASTGWASSFTGTRAALHRRLLDRAGPGHGPAVVLAEQDGRPVGALYGFRWRDTFAYYQTGWEPELAALNLATVLVAEAVERAAADGARVFDFLRGTEDYKYRFGAVDRVDRSWLLPAGAGGVLLRGRAAVQSRVRGSAA